MRKIAHSLVNVFNEVTNLYQYQSETCLFQSELFCLSIIIQTFKSLW